MRLIASVFLLSLFAISSAAQAATESLCTVHIASVKGIHSQPMKSLTEEALNLEGCKSEAISKMKELCLSDQKKPANLKAKYDFFDSTKFDMKKGVLSHSCGEVVADKSNLEIESN